MHINKWSYYSQETVTHVIFAICRPLKKYSQTQSVYEALGYCSREAKRSDGLAGRGSSARSSAVPNAARRPDPAAAVAGQKLPQGDEMRMPLSRPPSLPAP
jgi:hypothetical protein